MTKLISLTDEAYNRLFKLKSGSSFSKLVLRLTEKKHKKTLLDFAGIWKGNKEIGRIFDEIAENRPKMRIRRELFE